MINKIFAATGSGGIVNPVAPVFTFGTFFSGIISIIIIIAFLAAFMFLLIGGFQWITSGGDETNLTNARNRIMHALIGLILVVAAWAIMALIGKFLGINFMEFTIPSLKD